MDPLKGGIDILKDLSGPIGYLLQDPKHRITRLTDAMDQFQAEREDINNRIRNAEHEGEVPNHQVKLWYKKVNDFNAKILKIKDDHENGIFRWSINRRAAQILADIKAFREEHTLVVLTVMLPPKRVQEVPAELPAAFTSNYLSKLKAFVKDDKSQIIGIWGMSGVGKTMLLNNLNNELSSETGQSQPTFDYVICAVASKDYKLEKLQCDIAKRLHLPLVEDTGRQATTIFNFLKNKGFVLLLDDLWNKIDLAELGIPHLSCTGATKQKVVFTTQLEVVCGKMQAHNMIKIECLEEAEAWQLFQDKVGDATLRSNPRIPELARRVAKECGGLPLALVLIGSAMSTKKTSREWQNAITLLQNSRPYEIFGVDVNIFSKLKLSYEYLPDEIFRKCFLLCSLWPEDYSISRNDLIECWMGHGLVDESKFHNINEAYDNGDSLISSLQDACLLEPGDNREREVKMHDILRDFALSIATDFGKKQNSFIVVSSIIAPEDLQKKEERISLVQSNINGTSFFPTNCLELKSIPFKSTVPEFFKGYQAMTYLDLSRTAIYDLPGEIGVLINLRYLNLSQTRIKSLPLQLGDLCNLRFLLLRDLRSISILSGVLEKLIMLSVIDMTNTWCNNWQELSRLHDCLKGVGIVLESIEDLSVLAKLSNVLIWRLGLRKLLGFNEPLQLLSPSQLGSCNIYLSIKMLKIEDSESLEMVSMKMDGSDDIQKFSLSRLEELELKSLPKLRNIIWHGVCPAKMLERLIVLKIDGCHNLSNISWVIRLPSLEDLIVCSCNDVQQIIDDAENGVGMTDLEFPRLRKLELSNLKNLTMFGRSFTFPLLESLQVINCSKMKSLPFGGEITEKVLKGISGGREWWGELIMEDEMRAKLLPYFKEK